MFKALHALASNLYAAIKGPFLTAAEGTLSDMFMAFQGKSRKEIEFDREVKKQLKILKAQEEARRKLSSERRLDL